MLELNFQREIIELIQNGFSEAEICRAKNVSRNAVRRLIRRVNQKTSPLNLLERLIRIPITEEARYERCPTCGKITFLPCKACLTKQYNQLCETPVEFDVPSDSEFIQTLERAGELFMQNKEQINTLDLRPEEQKRYEQIRRLKELEAEALLQRDSNYF